MSGGIFTKGINMPESLFTGGGGGGGYSRNFDAESLGAATNYTQQFGGAYVLTVTATGAYSGRDLLIDSNSAASGHGLWYDSANQLSSGDCVITAKIAINNSTNRAGIVARHDTDTGDSYVLMMRGADSIRLTRWTGVGGENNIATTTLGASYTLNTFYNLEFTLSGSSLEGRVWVVGGSRPSTADVSATDANLGNTRLNTGVYTYVTSAGASTSHIDEIVET